MAYRTPLSVSSAYPFSSWSCSIRPADSWQTRRIAATWDRAGDANHKMLEWKQSSLKYKQHARACTPICTLNLRFSGTFGWFCDRAYRAANAVWQTSFYHDRRSTADEMDAVQSETILSYSLLFPTGHRMRAGQETERKNDIKSRHLHVGPPTGAGDNDVPGRRSPARTACGPIPTERYCFCVENLANIRRVCWNCTSTMWTPPWTHCTRPNGASCSPDTPRHSGDAANRCAAHPVRIRGTFARAARCAFACDARWCPFRWATMTATLCPRRIAEFHSQSACMRAARVTCAGKIENKLID